jgi:hypothetical protein
MPDSILDDKNERLNSVPDGFVKSVSGLESDIMKSIEKLVSTLETENGQILLNDRNMAIIENINQTIKNIIFTDEYEKNLTSFIGEFGKQAQLSNEYFQVVLDDFEVKPVYSSLLKSTQRNAIQLLNDDAFSQVLINPIKETLESSLVNNVSFTDTIKNLRYIIEGDETVDGRLISHVKRVAYDSFAVSDRSYTNTIATDLGLEFYRYTGGTIDTTRCFCQERHGKFYHREEIKRWGKGLDLGVCKSGDLWQGANTNTDEATIFFYAGGYSCKHSLLPVSEISVPKADKQRAIEKGYYKVAL